MIQAEDKGPGVDVRSLYSEVRGNIANWRDQAEMAESRDLTITYKVIKLCV